MQWKSKLARKPSTSDHPFPPLYELEQRSSYEDCDVVAELSGLIMAFASGGGELVGRFVKNLERFTKPHKTDCHIPQTGIPGSGSLIECPDEYPASVNKLLYATLSEHSRCSCDLDDGETTSQEHLARLKLGPRMQLLEGHVSFDAIFSAEPDSPWQQLRFEVPKYNQHLTVLAFRY